MTEASDGQPPKDRPRPSGEQLAEHLSELLTVEEIDRDVYRGPLNPYSKGRVFGGQVIAQALAAASATVDPDRRIHSLHAYFLRPGDSDLPILHLVDRDFDGGTFSNRRVVARQNGMPILNLVASFQRPEEGYDHARPMPDVPPPEEVMTNEEAVAAHGDALPEQVKKFLLRSHPLDIRRVANGVPFALEPKEPEQHMWFRLRSKLPGDDVQQHRIVLAYATDIGLLSTSMLPHGESWLTGNIIAASIDHAVWFHADAPVDEWLLYTMESPWAGHGRGHNYGRIYTRDGTLVADIAQEGLIRRRRPK